EPCAKRSSSSRPPVPVISIRPPRTSGRRPTSWRSRCTIPRRGSTSCTGKPSSSKHCGPFKKKPAVRRVFSFAHAPLLVARIVRVLRNLARVVQRRILALGALLSFALGLAEFLRFLLAVRRRLVGGLFDLARLDELARAFIVALGGTVAA